LHYRSVGYLLHILVPLTLVKADNLSSVPLSAYGIIDSCYRFERSDVPEQRRFTEHDRLLTALALHHAWQVQQDALIFELGWYPVLVGYVHSEVGKESQILLIPVGPIERLYFGGYCPFVVG